MQFEHRECKHARTVSPPTGTSPEGPSATTLNHRVPLFGAFAATRPSFRSRLSPVLAVLGFYACLWLFLSAAPGSVLDDLGLLLAGLTPGGFAYAALSLPSGRLADALEHRIVVTLGATTAAVWLLAVLTGSAITTPLADCCATSPVIEHARGALSTLIEIAGIAAWTAMVCATPALLVRRMRGASAPLLGLLVPIGVVAAVNALCWVGFLVAHAAGAAGVESITGTLYLLGGVMLGLGAVVGLAAERLVMGDALARFAAQLAHSPKIDPEVLLATTIGDPSLRIAYPRTIGAPFVDAAGLELALPLQSSRERAVAWVTRGRVRVAAVIYDARLADQERFVRAAGQIALLQLENAQLQADVRARTREIAASRIRLVEAADAERQRIERDLHDGVQQQVMGMRLRLDLATRALDGDEHESRRLLSTIGRQMDDLLGSVRSLSRGVYPALLTDRGLPDALRSVARQLPVPASVSAHDVDRCPQDVEVAVYFCCLEAMQNAVKYAGPNEPVRVGLRTDGDRLRFEIVDRGAGFDPAAHPGGHGLLNMHDRIEAVGGELQIRSTPGRGAAIRGSVPLAPQP